MTKHSEYPHREVPGYIWGPGREWTPRRLRDFRKRASYTQDEMADMVGVSLQSYQSWEQGRRQTNAENAAALDYIQHAYESGKLDWSFPVVGLTPAGSPIMLRSRPEKAYLRLQAGKLVGRTFMPLVDMLVNREYLTELLSVGDDGKGAWNGENRTLQTSELLESVR